jgi:P pilus assembly chaperone PapD
MKIISFCSFFMCLCLVSSIKANAAYILSPSSVDMVVNPKDNRPDVRSIYIDNKNKESIALEIIVFKRQIIGNKDKLEPMTKEEQESILSIYPKQFIVKPDERRTVRFTYKGPRNIQSEVAYRFSVRRIMVDMAKKSLGAAGHAKLDMVIDLMGALYVVPSTGKSNVVVSSFKQGKGALNELKIKVTNKGNMHKLLLNYDLKVTYTNNKGDMKTTTLSESDLSKDDGSYFSNSKTNVLPGAEKEIVFPLKDKDIKEVKNVELLVK